MMLPLPRVSDHFQIDQKSEKTHNWVLACHNSGFSPVEALAETLAIRIMQHRLIGCPHHFRAWEEHFIEGKTLPSNSREAIIAFTKPAFGLPNDPESIPIDHLEGLVSQYLWYFLCLETSLEPIIKDIPPGFKATDPGGDALLIHRVSQGDLRFRLWEIKKFVQRSVASTTTANSTIEKAYKQLEENATEYLARYTSIGQELEADLKDFFGMLVDLWIDRRPEASAGVSLNTSEGNIPIACFHSFGDHFPEFINPVRLQGMISAVDDFTAFSVKVKDFIWKDF